MNLHAASSHRVARSWLLEKLLGPEKKAPSSSPSSPPRARAMTDREREHLLETAYESLKSDLQRAIRAELPGLGATEKRLANKHGIDPLFLNWFVIHSKHWPSMPKRTKDALRAIKDMRLWFGELPPSWNNMQVPQMESGRQRDTALRELGEWFLKNSVKKIERSFTNAIWKKSRELLDAFKGRGKGSKAQASVLLLRDFKNRLGADRFQLKPAVRRVVELFD